MTKVKNKLNTYEMGRTTLMTSSVFVKERQHASSNLEPLITYLFLLLCLILHLFPVPQFFDIFHL